MPTQRPATVNFDNPLWVLCCCGCLPFVGLVKGAIVCVPVCLLHVLCNTVRRYVI